MITKCKKCGSNNLYLEPRIAGQDILTANMVALKCKDCSSWLKWCPKNERVNYLKIQDETGQNGTNQDEIGQDIKWQKLKEWLESEINNCYHEIENYKGTDINHSVPYYRKKHYYEDILEKMQELEKENAES